MKVGIVDIGSNTIRLVVYDVIDMTYKEILNQRSLNMLMMTAFLRQVWISW